MNQGDHWAYTLNEWKTPRFEALLDEAFSMPVSVVWDVGACVGGWSQVVAERHHPKHIVAFEPFPDNYAALVAHAIPGVEAVNKGIWYGKKRASASWRGSNIGAIFIDEVDETMSYPTGKYFDLMTLEEARDLGFISPDLIKFDVEGAEKNIIEHSTMLKDVPQLIVEWHYMGHEDAEEFFKKHLPHRVVSEIEKGMYLLRV